MKKLSFLSCQKFSISCLLRFNLKSLFVILWFFMNNKSDSLDCVKHMCYEIILSFLQLKTSPSFTNIAHSITKVLTKANNFKSPSNVEMFASLKIDESLSVLGMNVKPTKFSFFHLQFSWKKKKMSLRKNKQASTFNWKISSQVVKTIGKVFNSTWRVLMFNE